MKSNGPAYIGMELGVWFVICSMVGYMLAVGSLPQLGCYIAPPAAEQVLLNWR